jgi:hypothetical protein
MNLLLNIVLILEIIRVEVERARLAFDIQSDALLPYMSIGSLIF